MRTATSGWVSLDLQGSFRRRWEGGSLERETAICGDYRRFGHWCPPTPAESGSPIARERAAIHNMVVERRGEGNPVRALAAPLAAPPWSPDPRTPARATCTHGRGRHPRPRGHTPQGHGHDPAHRQAVPEQQPPSQIGVVGGRQSPTRRTRRPSLLRVVGLASAGASTVAPWRRRPDRAGT